MHMYFVIVYSSYCVQLLNVKSAILCLDKIWMQTRTIGPTFIISANKTEMWSLFLFCVSLCEQDYWKNNESISLKQAY